MGINGWSFPSVAARRNAYTDSFIIRPARGIFQSFFPNFGFRNPVQIYAANSVSRENALEVPTQEERDPRRRSCISIILGQPSVAEKVHAGQASLLAICGIPAIPHCPPAHGGMYFSSVTQKFPDIFRFPAHTYFPFSCKYCYREENASFGAEKGEMIYESYRYRSPGRRLGYNRSKVRKP